MGGSASIAANNQIVKKTKTRLQDVKWTIVDEDAMTIRRSTARQAIVKIDVRNDALVKVYAAYFKE